MLVLQRSISEKIIITCKGERIEVMLVEIRDKTKARIGVHAADHVTIDRLEIYESKLLGPKEKP